ncbi:hypothetical protein L873DRAFT_1819162 [Choiromyces venosus 120613-1]|uniref:Zn(2)-C6 fungal-type domain-containing protein n=1 Tax=Choiromyces venosus 120613-1 TaxID=1336337 RepID=A0A3N4J353_9PEZI|nr:hypothetical protein L873DRAFT_1819162 [Choiromyces venosus 120613-1]
MGSPDSHTTPSAGPTANVPLPPATAPQRRASTVNGPGPATNGSRASDHENSSEDETRQDRGDAGSEGARKRRRIDGISSCETCKQRKVKCDRAQPSCGWCSRNGQECIYRLKKKPGLRAGIGRELEERLDRVEAMLATHSQILENHIQPTQAQFPSPSSASQEHLSPSISHPGPAEPILSAISRAPVPQFTATSLPPQTPFSSGPGMPADVAFREQNHIGDLSNTKSFDVDLPTDDLLCTMVDMFFQNIYPTCPILHRQTIVDSFFGRPLSEVEESDVILMHAIVSATLRFCTDRRLEESWKEHFRSVAKRKVIFYALENPSVQSLRALVIIVLDVVGSTNGPSGWGLLALTTRMALHLGLAVEPSREALPQISTMGAGILPDSKDWIEEEGRRRLFWMVYLLDIYTTLGTSLDLTLDESEIDRLLPCRDHLWDRNQHVTTRWFRTPRRADQSVNNVESLSAFSYLIEVLGILGRIHRFLRETVDINVLSDVEAWQLKYRTLDKALTSWKFSLPMSYGNLTRALNLGGTVVDPSWIILHAAYNTAVIRLHSSAAYPTTRSSIFGPSYSAGQRCLSAVENVAALTRLVILNNMLHLLGSTFAFTVWVAARLLLVHASTTEYSTIPDVRLFLDALREMGKIYHTAERYSTIIQRVVDELAQTQRPTTGAGSDKTDQENNNNNNSQVTPRTCVGILSDMRMTAYAVDVMISRQPDARRSAANLGFNGIVANGDASDNPSNSAALDYLDVFNWFNFPRVAPGAAAGSAVDTNGQQGMVQGFAPMGTEETDWLF